MTNPPDGKYIKRCYPFAESRAETETGVLQGHAAVYGQAADIGGYFIEILAQGAFERTDLSDVALYCNHNTKAIPLARRRQSIPNSTMKVVPDEKGLFMDALLDIVNNAEARALVSSVARQDITGMSYAFIVGDEKWEGLDTEMPTRTIITIAKVIEVSAVTHPAYEGTDIGARSDSLESDRAALERARLMIQDRQEIEKMRLLAQIRSM